MNWHQIGHAVLDIAPTLAGAITGPYGAIAGTLLSKALGTEFKPQAILDALQGGNGALDKVKEVEDLHGVWLSMLNNLKSPSSISINVKIDFPPVFQQAEPGLAA